ncbi:MAG: succinylglutamate desuccinylase, partial [Sphingomonadaceae bacterium]|nr:succinylglutamate desuccinylase [Sphingomonadaceae bacterium]
APAGEDERALTSPIDGIVIGHSNLPIVNQGDALLHIAELEAATAEAHRDARAEAMLSTYLLDEDEVM